VKILEKRQAFNPYLPSWEYVPDGEPRIFGDRLYVYGSHDRFNGKGFCLNDYVCWSAALDDLGNWRYEGVIYRKDQDPKNAKGKMNMNAPDVVQGSDGRYYLYYQLAVLTCTSVAVSDRPEGPYEFYGYVEKNGVPYGEQKGEPFCFDPGVLVDDDGRIWLYVGFSPAPGWMYKLMRSRGNVIDGGYCVELAADMKTVISEPTLVIPGPSVSEGTPFHGHGFYEASSPRKIRGKYYLTYSSILSHELCYAVSDYPDRDYRYGGTLVSIGDVGVNGCQDAKNYTGNTHGGMVQIHGQWYIFYHRQTNKQKCARQACAEKIYPEEDGSIAQAEVTSCGLNDGPLAGKGTYEARIACHLWAKEGTFAYLKTFEKDPQKRHPYFTQSGADREGDADQYIANMRCGATAGFKYFALQQPGAITVRVRGKGQGTMEVRTAPDGAVIAAVSVFQKPVWRSFTADITSAVDGVHALYFTYNGEGFVDFDSFTLHE
jgi:hypothetical protein